MEDTTVKSTRFAFTAYEGEWPYFLSQPPNDLIAEWGWQEEVCPDSGRHHLQGFLRTKRQTRMSTLIKIYKGVHLEVARNWAACKNYSYKAKSAVPGTQKYWISEQKALTMKDTLLMIASNSMRLQIVGRCSRIFQEDETGKIKPPTKQELKQEIIEEYWAAVNEILMDQPDLIGLLSQPQYQRAWENTRQVWIDRQTAIEKQAEAEESALQ